MVGLLADLAPPVLILDGIIKIFNKIIVLQSWSTLLDHYRCTVLNGSLRMSHSPVKSKLFLSTGTVEFERAFTVGSNWIAVTEIHA